MIKVFERFISKRKKEKTLREQETREKIQKKLDILEGLGIRAKNEDFIDWIYKDWGKDRDEPSTFSLLLFFLSIEWYEDDIGTYASDDAFWFDMECIEDGSEYECIIKRLSDMTKGELTLSNIKACVDHDNCTVSLSFEHNNVKYDWNPVYDNDWFDENVITKLNHLLQEQGSKKFFYNCVTDQCANLIFVSEDAVGELNKLVSDPYRIA